MARKDVDWEKVETAYRAGYESLREIAKRYGITEAAIRRRAKANNWQRDLGVKITRRAEVIMQREMAKHAQPTANEREVVEVNALLVSEVGLSHKLLATKAREKGTELLARFDVNDPETELTTQTRLFKDIVTSLESVVKLERLAFGLDKTETTADQQQNLSISFVQPTKTEEIIVHE